MVKTSVIKSYLEAGKSLTLIQRGASNPILEDWVNETLSEKALIKHVSNKGNLGFAIGLNDLVIDVDPRNGGDQSYEKFKEIFGDFKPNTFTPRGGFHIYLKLPKKFRNKKFRGKRLKTKHPKFEGIDFLHYGHQVVIPTSKRPDGTYKWGSKKKFFEVEAPEKLILMLLKGGASDKKKGKTTDLERAIANSSWTKERVKEMVLGIPNDENVDYDTWCNVGMALNDWHPHDGLKIWVKWSKRNKEKHDGPTLRKKWKSFTGGGGITLGTIAYLSRKAGFNQSQELMRSLTEDIRHASEKELRFDISERIKKTTLDDMNREILAQSIKSKMKSITKVSLPIAKVRKMIRPNSSDGQIQSDIDRPKWSKGWIYVTSHTGFFKTYDRSLHKSEGFNLECGKYVPMNDSGNKATAVKFCSDNGFITKADKLAYLPFQDGSYCEIEGVRYCNTFNPNSVPHEADDFTKSGKKAIKVIKDHFKFVCGNDEYADILIKWIAHNVQYMGVKIEWSPLLQSIEGTGKTFLGQLMINCLGHNNVGIVSPSVVCSDFNDYANGVAVNILQELRIVGQNRHMVANALKPLISDNYISYHPKGAKAYSVINTCNYIATTNFKDAVPLTDTDRRWFIIFMGIQDIKEMRRYTGLNNDDYYTRLFGALNKHGAEIKKWLLEIDLTEFKKIKRAPITHHRQAMVATEAKAYEGVTEVKRMIEKGNKFFNEEAVSILDLFNAMTMEHTELEFSNRDKPLILKRLGYAVAPERVKIGNFTREIWTKRPMTSKQIRKSLKKVKPKLIE